MSDTKELRFLRDLKEVGDQIICPPAVGKSLVEKGYAVARDRTVSVSNNMGGSSMVITEFYATDKAIQFASEWMEDSFQEGEFVPPEEGDSEPLAGPSSEEGIEF